MTSLYPVQTQVLAGSHGVREGGGRCSPGAGTMTRESAVSGKHNPNPGGGEVLRRRRRSIEDGGQLLLSVLLPTHIIVESILHVVMVGIVALHEC